MEAHHARWLAYAAAGLVVVIIVLIVVGLIMSETLRPA